MQVSLVAPGSGEWRDALARVPHDVYHLPEYAEVCAATDGGEPRALIAAEGHRRLLVPLILRELPEHLRGAGETRDATVPYGYPAPVACVEHDGEAAPFVERAMAALIARLRDERIVSAFFRLHPLLPIEHSVLSRFGSLVPSGETVAIDLSLPEEERWRQMRSNHRRDVTKASGRGETAGVDANWSSLPAFLQAYRETMGRVGANAYYLFPDDYFNGLRESLGDAVHLWTSRSGGEVTAGAVFTECNGIVQYHLGGTITRYLPGNPIKLLFHRAAEWFRSRGNRWLHLGGGVGGAADSLMHFKLGFSPRTFAFYTWRVVIDDVAYDDLTRRAGRTPTTSEPLTSYFPAYRETIQA